MIEHKILGADLNYLFDLGDGVEDENLIDALADDIAAICIEVVEELCHGFSEVDVGLHEQFALPMVDLVVFI